MAQGTEHMAQGTEHMAQGTGRRAQGTGRRTQGAGRRAQGAGGRAACRYKQKKGLPAGVPLLFHEPQVLTKIALQQSASGCMP